ncbi:unannotated protein [freshwater metagenome]|uniref:Unannotated protein n=1 Tax=freshwater metagenome TaxID=449393 RepID=A0A6J6UVV9_9ZZZZ
MPSYRDAMIAAAFSGVPRTVSVSTISSVIWAAISAHLPAFDSALSSGCRSPQPCTSSVTRYDGVDA